MAEVAVGLFWFLVALIVGQALLVAGFVIALRRFRRPLLADVDCPPATVILCLRGTDPFLPACLDAIARQDYPHYRVRVVVDHRDDAAWGVVERTLQQNGARNFTIEELANRLETCSLKCSSIVQVARSLDAESQFIAQLDADTIPHATWLRELATALHDPQVGAATGNRWYMPDDSAMGALIRYYWNAAAVVQMFSYRIAWGGTLAVKTSVIREAQLIDKWSRAFCEDTMLFSQMKPFGYRLAFVPSLMMVNRETCHVPGFFSWVRRQLLTARLYHPGWPAVVGHGLITFFVPLVVLLMCAWSWWHADLTTLRWTLAATVVYQLSLLPMILPMEMAVRAIMRQRGENPRWLSAAKFVALLFALPATQVVYTAALISAMFVRVVDWRGIRYEIQPDRSLRLIRYQPYSSAQTSSEAPASSL